MNELPEFQEIPLSDLPDEHAVIQVPLMKKKRRVLGYAMRRTTGFVVYLDSCPHFGSPLSDDGIPLDATGNVTCSAHRAAFNRETGICFQGPCAGKGLTEVPFEVTGEALRIRTQIARPRPTP